MNEQLLALVLEELTEKTASLDEEQQAQLLAGFIDACMEKDAAIIDKLKALKGATTARKASKAKHVSKGIQKSKAKHDPVAEKYVNRLSKKIEEPKNVRSTGYRTHTGEFQ